MGTFVPLEQGTPEWHRWRADGIGGSDAPVIMEVSPYDTPYSRFLQKTGRVPEKAETRAMRNGKVQEPQARAHYEELTGLVVEPSCWEHDHIPWMRASTDGRTLDGDCVVEIKVPNEHDHRLAKQGLVPEKYKPQCQHIIAVTGCQVLHYYSWRSDDPAGALVDVYPNSAYIAELIEREEAFWRCVVELTPPPLTPRDVQTRSDHAWCELAEEYRRLEAEIAERSGKFDATRAALIAQMGDRVRVEGGGLTATRYPVRGNVDYGKVPQLAGVDLEPYRKHASERVRITVK